MTVYILHETKDPRDFSTATQYGKFDFIFSQDESPTRTPGPCLFKARQRLRSFDPNEDFLLWAGGDPTALLLVGAVLAELNLHQIKYLRWERNRLPNGERSGGFYVPTNLNMRQS